MGWANAYRAAPVPFILVLKVEIDDGLAFPRQKPVGVREVAAMTI